MVHFPPFLDGLTKSVSLKKEKKCEKDFGREAVEAMVKEAKKKQLLLSSSGIINSNKSNNFASICSKRGQKGINQDSTLVWEEYGCQEDMMLCGIFDGHGPWGHIVSKRVRDAMASLLLCSWQQTLALTTSHHLDLETEFDLRNYFAVWKASYVKTYAAIDRELKNNPNIDSYRSGTTALTIIKHGDQLVIANVGDSRAVLATISDDDDSKLVSHQLTVDFKPSLPQEAERIRDSKGRVFCLEDEPGVYRVWMPDRNSPGLALSRALGDYCVKDFGLISVPDVTRRKITCRDQFVILASDGVWDVISNEEAVGIVSSTVEREKAAKKLVDWATRAWKYKKKGIAMDDISAICLFFHPKPSHI